MGRVQNSAWYDALFAGSAEYHKPARDSVYLPVWNRMLDEVRPDETVADFGCGPGQLAHVAFARDIDYRLGVDFSPQALAMARRNNPDFADVFELGDLTDPRVAQRGDYDVALFCEVLEHIEGDLELLSAVPIGRRVVLSVPTFDSASHVRFFAGVAAVVDRYRRVLELDSVMSARTTNGATLIIAVGRSLNGAY